MTTETTHLHDLGITISAGDLNPDDLRVVQQILLDAAEEVAQRVNSILDRQAVHASVSYNGAAECGEH